MREEASITRHNWHSATLLDSTTGNDKSLCERVAQRLESAPPRGAFASPVRTRSSKESKRRKTLSKGFVSAKGQSDNRQSSIGVTRVRCCAADVCQGVAVCEARSKCRRGADILVRPTRRGATAVGGGDNGRGRTRMSAPLSETIGGIRTDDLSVTWLPGCGAGSSRRRQEAPSRSLFSWNWR